MKRWRVIFWVSLGLAVVFILSSVLLFEDAWSWYPWKAPMAMRHRMLLPWQRGGANMLSAVLAGWLARLLIGTIVLFLFPRRVRVMSDTLAPGGREILRQLLIGLLVSVGIAGVMLAAIFSAHTFPITVVLGLAYVTISMIGIFALSYRLGGELMGRAGWEDASPLYALWVGITLLFALTRVPLLGVLVFILIWALGSGLVISTRFGSGAPWTLAPLKEDRKP